MAYGQTRLFVKQFITKTAATGALLPSSSELAKRMVDFAAPKQNAVIVEYGPGTGVFTQRIFDTLKHGQRFFAIEINDEFYANLRKRFPDLSLYHDCASNIRECCRKEEVEQVDCVISGLPWAMFPDELQDKILGPMLEMLAPGGVFVTFAYLQGLVMPAGRKFKQNLKRRFSHTENSGVIWKNLPPAIIYRAVK